MEKDKKNEMEYPDRKSTTRIVTRNQAFNRQLTIRPPKRWTDSKHTTTERNYELIKYSPTEKDDIFNFRKIV